MFDLRSSKIKISEIFYSRPLFYSSFFNFRRSKIDVADVVTAFTDYEVSNINARIQATKKQYYLITEASQLATDSL